MKSLSRWTVRISVSGILFLGTLLSWGQGGNPPASTKESGATSGHGYTAVEQTVNVEREIRDLHDQGRQAALSGDTNFFEKCLASKYLGIGGDGRLRTKPETIQEFKSGAIKYQSIDEHDVQVNTYGNTAIVNSMASVKLTANGKAISGDFRATFVYLKLGGIWREASFQATPVAAEGH